MVFEYKILPLKNDLRSSEDKRRDSGRSRKKIARRFKNRRKALEDRRAGVRDGVIVRLSVKNERRIGKDRRQNED